MRLFLAVCMLFLTATLLGAQQVSDIRALLQKQVEAWNRGDIDGFMQTYWKSEQTVFVGSNGVTRGWQQVLERYRKVYPDRAAMGALSFSELDVKMLAPDAAVVLGHWQLRRATDAPGGYFTLIVRKLPDGWHIVHDHSSAVQK